MIRFLLDTNTVSERARPHPNPAVVARLAAAAGEVAIAALSWHELLFGLELLGQSKRRATLEAYLHAVVHPAVPVLPFDAAAAGWHARERAHLVRRGLTPSFGDGQIAATAAVHKLVLVTRNTKDFAAYRGLQVEDWFA